MNLIDHAKVLAEDTDLLLGNDVRKTLRILAEVADIIDSVNLNHSEPAKWAEAIDTVQYMINHYEERKGGNGNE